MSDTVHPLCQHPAPRSRREFLAQGLLSSAAYFLAPSLLTAVLGQRSALAASGQVTNALSPQSGMLPFLTIDCAGGAALPASFLVGDAGGNILSPASAAYSMLGFNPNDVTLQRDFGVPMAGPSRANPSRGNVSRILEGQAGLRGRLIQTIGTDPTTHGGWSRGPFIPTLTPLAVGSAFDLMSALR